MATTFAAKTASSKQIAFIQALLTDRQAPRGLAAGFTPDMTAVAASRMIDKLTKCPWKTAKTQTAAKTVTEIVPEGFYCVGVDYYKVQTSKTTGKRYAKIWTGSAWSYNAGGVYKLTLADKMTAEQAAMFGHKTGSCINCHKVLTKKHSQDLGYGPVCAENNGWPY
jgi:hypothetical protein